MHETFNGNVLGLGFCFFFRDWGGGGGVVYLFSSYQTDRQPNEQDHYNR